MPEEWGGYRVRPEVVEFWQGRPGRMHDRLVYRRDGNSLAHRAAGSLGFGACRCWSASRRCGGRATISPMRPRGTAGVVFVAGEAGVGKTTFVDSVVGDGRAAVSRRPGRV